MFEIANKFPYDTIRSEQETVLKELAAKWDNYKYFILQCDVGVGKSGIAKTACNNVSNSYIITETKQLQDQYMSDFKKDFLMKCIKGRSNYICNVNNAFNCEDAPCSLDKVFKDDKCVACKYFKAKGDAIISPCVVASYAYIFMTMRNAVDWSEESGFQKRDLAVFDECHTMESRLKELVEFKLNPVELDRLGILDNCKNVEEYNSFKVGWQDGFEKNTNRIYRLFKLIHERADEVKADQNDYLEEVKKENKSSFLAKMTNSQALTLKGNNKCSRDISMLDEQVRYYESHKTDDWFIRPADNNLSLQFSPMSVDGIFNKYCEKAADKFIFMSATILDSKQFAKELGLDESKVCYIQCNSTFDPKKSPIYSVNCGSMSYNNVDETLPVMEKMIQYVLNKFPNSRGIIHTGNYKIASAIYQDLNNSRFLMKMDKDMSNEELLRLHERKSDSVLLSPSMMAGVNLKDELARFQIIAKLPFMSLQDPFIKEKMNRDKDWYAIQMLRQVIQACGRATRSSDDWSATYCFDSAFSGYIQRYRKYLPSTFLDRIIFK